MTESAGKSREADWKVVATGLATGVDRVGNREVSDVFMTLLEAWIRERVLEGPAADPGRCRLRPRFRMLRDVHGGFEFISEILLEREMQRQAGNLGDRDWLAMTPEAGLAHLASASWLRFRALSFMGRESAAGFVGMPEENRSVTSLDGDADGGPGDRIGTETASGTTALPVLEVLARLSDGRPVLVLEIDDLSSAVVATAGLQTLPRLDPDGATTTSVRETVETSLAETMDRVGEAHEEGRRQHVERLEDIRRRLRDHPGMTIRTREDLERQLVQTEAARLFWPLIGSEVSRLLGLPSVNAGEQRNTKYRRALPKLLPRLAALLHDPGEHEGAS